MSDRRRPKIFLGSSSRSEHVVQELDYHLKGVAHVTSWPYAFRPGQSTFEQLREHVAGHDFAAFVFSPDDQLVADGSQASNDAKYITRDNVIFELGMFSSRLGSERVFLVKEASRNLHILTDYNGITYLQYDAPANASQNDPRWRQELAHPAKQIKFELENWNPPDESAHELLTNTAVSTSNDPTALLLTQINLAARGESLSPARIVRPGKLVVHGELGAGAVIGFDPEGRSNRMIRVRFSDGVAIVAETELFEPPTK